MKILPDCSIMLKVVKNFLIILLSNLEYVKDKTNFIIHLTTIKKNNNNYPKNDKSKTKPKTIAIATIILSLVLAGSVTTSPLIIYAQDSSDEEEVEEEEVEEEEEEELAAEEEEVEEEEVEEEEVEEEEVEELAAEEEAVTAEELYKCDPGEDYNCTGTTAIPPAGSTFSRPPSEPEGCPAGMTREPVDGGCVPEQPSQLASRCQPDEYYDPAQEKCIKKQPLCQPDEYYDPAQEKCIDNMLPKE